MSAGIARFQGLNPAELHFQVSELYAEYVACIDEGDLERWPDFFTEKCNYQCIARENHDRGLPLSAWLCESKGMLLDRVEAIRNTNTYAPRHLRHLVGSIRLKGWKGDALQASASYAVFETLLDDVTRVFNVGRYLDQIVAEEGRLKFKEKLCVFDSILIPNSLIFPI